MTQEQKTIKLAELEGWHFVEEDSFFWMKRPDGRRCSGSPKKPSPKAWKENFFYLPRYFEDLNATHKLEKAAAQKHPNFWSLYLDEGVGTLPEICEFDDNPPECATASQRAEAIGRVLNLWEE